MYGLPYILFYVTFLVEAICFRSMAFSPKFPKKKKKERRDAIEGVLMDLRYV